MNDLFTLPQKYLDLREDARRLAASLEDRAAAADESSRTDPQVRAALAASGLAEITVPAAFGGRFAEVDSLAVTVVREQLAATSGHLDSMFAMQGIGSFALAAGGTEEIRSHWLPKVAKLDAMAALALTEPDIGSDLKSLSTTIRHDGDELVVDGRKSFITNAGDADFYCVLGRENDGYSMVLVPSTVAGLTVEHPHQIIAPHVLGDVVMEGVRVPQSHRIGQPGEAFRLVLATLATFRVSVAGAAVGLADRALAEALTHTKGRQQFGRPLAELGPVSQGLALSWTEIEMARSMVYRAAAAAARDPQAGLTLSSMAKVGATEISGRVVDRCVQYMGRFGLVDGSVMERLYREVRPMRIYEGATEVLLDALSRQLTRKGAVL